MDPGVAPTYVGDERLFTRSDAEIRRRHAGIHSPSASVPRRESPEVAARRELREETGYAARALTPLARFNASTGISDEVFHVFLATGLQLQGAPRRELTEQMELVTMPLDQAVRLAESGEMRDSSSALAVLLAERHLRSS